MTHANMLVEDRLKVGVSMVSFAYHVELRMRMIWFVPYQILDQI